MSILSFPASAHDPLDNDSHETLDYDDVAPIFQRYCVMCHVPNGILGVPPEGYRLDSYEEIISADERARVVPGNFMASELYRRVRGHAKPRMPFNGPPYLSEEDIQRIAHWIEDGARNAAGEPAPGISGARIRLHGGLNQVWKLDGLPIEVGSKTRIKKSIGVGRYVRVEGYIGAKGEIVVEQIKQR